MYYRVEKPYSEEQRQDMGGLAAAPSVLHIAGRVAEIEFVRNRLQVGHTAVEERAIVEEGLIEDCQHGQHGDGDEAVQQREDGGAVPGQLRPLAKPPDTGQDHELWSDDPEEEDRHRD